MRCSPFATRRRHRTIELIEPSPENGAAPDAVSVARGTAYGVVADAVSIITALLAAVLIARFLGPANRGVYFLVLYVATLVVLVGDLGLSTSGIVHAAKGLTSRERMHGTAIVLSLGVTLVTALALLLLQPLLSRTVLKGVTARDMWFIIAGVGPLLYAQTTSAMLTGLGRVPQLSIIRLWTSVLALVITAVALWASDGETIWALAAWLVSTLILAAWTGAEAVRRMGTPRWPSSADARGLFGFGARSHLGTLSHHGFLRADVLFISARLGPAAVGEYSLASLLAERLSLLGSAVYAAGASHVGSRALEDASELTARMIRVVLALLLPAATVLALFAHPLITILFGSDFEPAVVPFVLLLPGTVCLTVWYLVSLHLIAALERPLATTTIQGVAMLISLPLYYVAVREWHMTGAAIVSSAVYISVMIAGIVVFTRATHVRARRLLPGRQDAAELRAIVHDAWRSRRPGGSS